MFYIPNRKTRITRCEFTGRSVIGADTTLSMTEFGVPETIAATLSVPERATVHNLEWLQGLVDAGRTGTIRDGRTGVLYRTRKLEIPGTAACYGDVVARKGPCKTLAPPLPGHVGTLELLHRQGFTPGDCQFVVDPSKFRFREGDVVLRGGALLADVRAASVRRVTVRLGDIVERNLMDGDMVLVNRQPTLHRGSMLAMRARIMSGKTFRLSLALTKSFNADFDGDEINVHVPQSIEARVELQQLCAAENCIVSASDSHPVITIVQDTMLAVYLMSSEDGAMSRGRFFDLSMSVGACRDVPRRVSQIRAALRRAGLPPRAFTARGLLSLVFPPTFCFKADGVVVEGGVLLGGSITKGILNRQMLHSVFEIYSLDVVVAFIDDIQRVAVKWLEGRSFSIGLEDCMFHGDRRVVDSIVEKYLFQADQTRRVTHGARVREAKVTVVLNSALNTGLRAAADDMERNGNNLMTTVKSGAKGALWNVTQVPYLYSFFFDPPPPLQKKHGIAQTPNRSPASWDNSWWEDRASGAP